MQNLNFKLEKCSRIAVFCSILCFSTVYWKDSSFALDGAVVAIYNDSNAPSDPITGAERSGAWQDGITAIKCMLNWMGISYEEISYQDLNDPTQTLSDLYEVLLFPGGFAYWYNYWISKSSKGRIRSFVNNGGGYFGICAGSFFASDNVVWEGIFYGDDYMYNAYGELTGYDLDLLSGTAIGPINGIAQWPTYGMTRIDFQNESEIVSGYKAPPFSEEMLYYGGPYFIVDQSTDVQGSGNYYYNGEPAIVAFDYGAGRVVLSGPHPEIEEDSQRDCVTIGSEDTMDDNGSDWELVLFMLKWIIETSAASTLYVSNGGNCGDKSPCYDSIQKAIDNAANISVILIKDGNYAEAIRLENAKTLLIKGGYNSTYDQQTANTTLIQAPGQTLLRASSGFLKFQMVNIK